MTPLAADLFCGLGGWTEGLLSEGWRVRGYDIEEHVYGDERYPGEFVLRDILQMHGREVADVDLIVSSSPCTEYSYMAMPWTRAKAKAAAIRADVTGQALRRLNALFDAQFRIQREASEAAGRYIPMVVENVRGAQPWVGRAAWNFGSYYLWGDVPALMPSALKSGVKVGGMGWYPPDDPRHQVGAAFNPAAQGRAFTEAREGRKNAGGSWFNIGSPGQKDTGNNPVHAYVAEGLKAPGGPHIRDGASHTPRLSNPAEHVTEGVKNRDADGYERDHPKAFGWKAPRTSSGSPGRKAVAEARKAGGDNFFMNGSDHMIARGGPGSSARKAASAKIAKIPFALSSHIARVYRPN